MNRCRCKSCSLVLLGLLFAATVSTGCWDFGRLFTFQGSDAGAPEGGTSGDSGPGADATIPCGRCGCDGPQDRDTAFTPGIVSFATTIQPIFDTTCAIIGPCHAVMVASLDLTAGNAYAAIVNVPAMGSASAASFDRITPGDPAASYLLAKVLGSHVELTGDCLFTGCQMPPLTATPCLDGQTLQTLWVWVEQGALDN